MDYMKLLKQIQELSGYRMTIGVSEEDKMEIEDKLDILIDVANDLEYHISSAKTLRPDMGVQCN